MQCATRSDPLTLLDYPPPVEVIAGETVIRPTFTVDEWNDLADFINGSAQGKQAPYVLALVRLVSDIDRRVKRFTQGLKSLDRAIRPPTGVPIETASRLMTYNALEPGVDGFDCDALIAAAFANGYRVSVTAAHGGVGCFATLSERLFSDDFHVGQGSTPSAALADAILKAVNLGQWEERS